MELPTYQTLSLDSIFPILSTWDRVSIHKYNLGKTDHTKITPRAMRLLKLIASQNPSCPELKYMMGRYLYFYHPETETWQEIENFKVFYPKTSEIMNEIKKQMLARSMIDSLKPSTEKI